MNEQAQETKVDTEKKPVWYMNEGDDQRRFPSRILHLYAGDVVILYKKDKENGKEFSCYHKKVDEKTEEAMTFLTVQTFLELEPDGRERVCVRIEELCESSNMDEARQVKARNIYEITLIQVVRKHELKLDEYYKPRTAAILLSVQR